MRRIILTVAAICAALLPAVASAHPLGNFTINQYARLTAQPQALHVRYVVDMAEIPAFQARQAIDADGDGTLAPAEIDAYVGPQLAALIGGLTLSVDGAAVMPTLTQHDLSFPPGQGGLTTLRLTLELAAPLTDGAHQIAFASNNYAERIGWREIVVVGDGVRLEGNSLPTAELSDELRRYPEDMLASPADVRSVTFGTAPGGPSLTATRSALDPGVQRSTDQLAGLIASADQTPQVMALALLLALLLGAGHALTPGHGKAIVAAYLVGGRGTVKHAIVLGLTTTVTHTAGVFALGLVTLLLSRYILPERLYPWLELASGALVIVIGVGLLRARLAVWFGRAAPHGLLPLDHAHGPDTHTHDGDFALADGALRPHTLGWRNVIALGISGGILPCPSALVVLLSAIALGRVGFGMLLIVCFSIGLAAVLSGIGIVLVRARGLFERFPSDGRLMKLLPIGSALAVTVAGLAITIAAVAKV